MNKNWFTLEDENDLKNVLNFIESLPDNLYQLINPKTSNFFQQFITEENEDAISPTLFIEAFNETKLELENGLSSKKGTSK